MMHELTYLDWAATAPLSPEARLAIDKAAVQLQSGAWGNPSSVHAPGRAARKALNDARGTLAKFFRVTPDDIIFTSGGTEALTLALSIDRPCLVGATEHSAVRNARSDAATILVDNNGLTRLDWLEENLPSGAIVAVQTANNETGVIQNISEIAALVHDRDGLLLADHVQAAGKLPIPNAADLVAVSGHKLGAPAGIGVLIARCPDNLIPRQLGGGQEQGLRGGTENLLGAIGFAAAATAIQKTDWEKVRRLRDNLEAEAVACGATIIAQETSRLPNISSLWLPNVEAATQLMALDMAGIAVSQGSACSSGTMKPSPTLLAMGLERAAKETIRVSLGPTTTEQEIERFLSVWKPLVGKKHAV